MGGRRFAISQEVANGWWRVVTTGTGERRILDPQGFDVLRHPDPLQRLRNTQLAGSSKVLRYALSEAVRELDRGRPGAHTREGMIVAWLYDVLHSTQPLYSDECELRTMEGQFALYLEAESKQGLIDAA